MLKSSVSVVAVVMLVLLGTVPHCSADEVDLGKGSVRSSIVAVTDYFAHDTGGTGFKMASALLCSDAGAFLAADPTQASHEKLSQIARDFSGEDEWYGFLGAFKGTPNRPEADVKPGFQRARCAQPRIIPDPPLVNGDPMWDSLVAFCNFRWNQGQWNELPDLINFFSYFPWNGVTFFILDTWYTFNEPTGRGIIGTVGDMAHFFDLTAEDEKDRRPGNFDGTELILMPSPTDNSKTVWSDNLGFGGYLYAGTDKLPLYSLKGFKLLEGNRTATINKFIGLCEVQAPYRNTYEIPNTSSQLQNLWWVIFFVLLFVICLVVFIVIAICQDREDLDEPAEDAPKWAEQGDVSRQYYSMRNFSEYSDADAVEGSGRASRGAEYEEEDYESIVESEKRSQDDVSNVGEPRNRRNPFSVPSADDDDDDGVDY